jgi:hypothetical protein
VIDVVGAAVQGAVTDKVHQCLDEELATMLFAGSTGSAGG